MPSLPPVAVLDAIDAPVTSISVRCEIFEANGTTRFAAGIYDDRLLDGSISVDYDRDERRSFSLTLGNSDLALQNSTLSIWYDKILKIYYRVIYSGTYFDIQLGEFCIDSIEQPHFPHVIKLTGRDYAKRCLNSKFVTTTGFAAGQALETVIAAIAGTAGISKRILPTTGVVINRDFFYERGVPRWEAMKEMANSYNYDIYFDNAGYLIMSLFQDPVTAPLIHTLKTGSDGNLASFTKKTNDTRIYNHIVVTGDSSDPDTIPVWAEAINTEPTSPTRVDKIGDIVFPYASAFITTQQQAQDVADSFLKVYALEEFNLDFGSICYPWFEVGFIVAFDNPFDGITTRMLLTSMSIPFGPGLMTGNSKRVSVVG